MPVNEGVGEFRPILVENEAYLGCQLKIYRSFEGMYIYTTPYGRSKGDYYTIAEAVSCGRELISRSILKGDMPYAQPKKKKTRISYPDYIRRNRYDRRIEGR